MHQEHRKPGLRRDNGIPEETTPLLNNGTAPPEHHEIHFWGEEDDRAWVAVPKKIAHITWMTLASNYTNVLLVFVPLGIIAGALGWNPTAVFVLNFLAIVPLAALLSFATEELSAKLGQTIGGLMNATFGNAVELIVRLCARLSYFSKHELTRCIGQYRCAPQWRNQNCAGRHARFNSLQHSSRMYSL
jgi:Ca2+:H+ antiporter